jgi:hypothetical protein
MFVWSDDDSLTEPKHVDTLDGTLKSVVLEDMVVQFIAVFYNTKGSKISRYL